MRSMLSPMTIKTRACSITTHIRKKWIAVAQRLQGRTDFQLQVVNGNIYILGGLNDWEILNSVECYDPSADEWKFMTPMPRDVIDFTSAVYRDSIYVFSGSRTMSYNTVTDLWTATLPAMTTPRLRSACVTHGNEIWVIGGSSAQSSTEVPCIQVEKYLPDEGKWEKRWIPPKPHEVLPGNGLPE